ncbi:MAG: hypothetical protein J2O48_12220 [Solirubrobacterales bacterium]|nr:hypothetical protein [Solirubrobacterales bacterium]
MAEQRRKRKQRKPISEAPKPPTERDNDWVARYAARGEAKNAEARAKLKPLEPGERPWPLLVAAALSAAVAIYTLVLMILNHKVDGHRPSAVWGVWVVAMLVVAVGLLNRWYQAILSFIALCVGLMLLSAVLLMRASNLTGLILGVAGLAVPGYLMWKLVGVLARVQMPTPPQRRK